MQTWPDGVTRCGGAARPGSLLEHRHIKSLLRNSKSKSRELDAAKALTAKNAVQEAAAKLARARSFSTDTLCDATFHDQLRSLLVHSPGSEWTEEEEEELRTLLSAGDLVKLEVKAAGYLRLWLPSNNECERLARPKVSPAVPVRRQRAAQAAEEEDKAKDRNMYRSFEEASVRFDGYTHADGREVLELLNPLSDGEGHHLLKRAAENMWNLSMAERVRLMHMMLRQRYNAWEVAYDNAMTAYNEVLVELRRHDLEQQVALLSGMKVVGMTISGASIYRDTIAALKPQHVLVEEAGEVLEPLLIAALGPWVKRLTLVGDHQQLPPSVETHQLAKAYNFNTSLMERLVNNGLKHETLCAQARMMPEMAQLLLDIYPDYRTSDRVDVQARSSPPAGAMHSMWWWDMGDGVSDHIDPQARSYVNEKEGTAVVALVKHFINSGVKPKNITVLASYSAQVSRIQRRVQSEVEEVSEGGWPSKSREGVAARTLLRTLDQQVKGGMASSALREAHGAQCAQVAQTFLKLGELLLAKKALQLVRQLGHSHDDAGQNLKRIEKLEKQQQRVDDFCQCSNDEQESQLLHGAIDALKRLEELAVRWRCTGSSGVPAAAACCVLVQEWARQIQGTRSRVINDGRRRLLEAISSGSRTHLAELSSLDSVSFSSVDRYQGSENDVVIVSLVRSNDDGNIGFLQERARRVVAQSRARLGMYFVGDQQTFSSSTHWAHLITDLQGLGRLSSSIPLCCPVHKQCLRKISLEDTSDVMACGVCHEQCDQLMSCGIHRCKRRCHGNGGQGGIDPLHMLCTEIISDKCAEGHTIQRRCFEAVLDVTCRTCDQIEKERRKKEERERKDLEERENAELERLINLERSKPPGLQKRDLQRHGSDAVEYLTVADRAERYAQGEHGGAIIVTRIEKLLNPELESAFLEAKKGLKSGAVNCNLQRLFHGTGAEGVEGIPRTGFRLPARSEDNMFGMAVYFATDSSKSFQSMYTKGSGCLLLCDVLLGNTCEIAGLGSRHPLKKHEKISSKGRLYLAVGKTEVRSAGFDSVFAPRGSRDKGGVQFDEMMVYGAAQAIPRYILHIGGGGSQMMRQTNWSAGAPQRVGSDVLVRRLKEREVGEKAGSRELEEFNMAVGQYMRLLKAQSRHVKQVDVYDSPKVQKAFSDKERELKARGSDGNQIWVFHGTAKENIEKICAGGFIVAHGSQIVNGAAYGNGVYTAKGPATPMGYARDTNAVILCLALPGRKGVQGQDDSWSPHEDWMIFKTAEQLWPKYVVWFE